MEPFVNGDFGEAHEAIPGGGDGFLGTTPADVWISKEFLAAVVDAEEEDRRGGVSVETAEPEKTDVLTMEESQIVAKTTGAGERVVFDEMSERQEVVAVEISGAGDFAEAGVESVEDEEVVTEGMVSTKKKALANSQEVLEVIKHPSTVASMETKIFPDLNGKTAEDSSGFRGSSPKDPPQPAVDAGGGKNADESGLVELPESEVVKTSGVGDHGTETQVPEIAENEVSENEVLEVIKHPSTVASMETKIFPDSNGKTAEDSSGFGASSPNDPPQPAVGIGGGKNADESSGLVELLESEVVKTSGVGDHGSETQVPEIAENENDNAVSPHPGEPTSWRGCCGMFDVLRRSD